MPRRTTTDLALLLAAGAAALLAGCRNEPVRIQIRTLNLHLSGGAAPDAAPSVRVTPVPVGPGQLPGHGGRRGEGRGLGRVSDGFVLLANAVPLKKASVRIDARGRVMKIAGYHAEASQIPEAVRRLAEQQFPQSRVREYESELQRGIGRVHEVKLTTRDGRKCDVSADDRGQLLWVECHLAPARLPAAIVQAVKAALPGGEIVEVETKKGPSVDRTEVKVKAGGQVHKLHFDPSARLIGHFLKVPAEIEVQVRR